VASFFEYGNERLSSTKDGYLLSSWATIWN